MTDGGAQPRVRSTGWTALTSPRRRLVSLFVLALLVTATGRAAAASSPPADAAGRHWQAGQQLAKAITVATGVPISPLLGVSGLLAYRWWVTPGPLRDGLPWYVHPGAWGLGVALALLFALNTTIGGLVPGLKKPMDFVEHYENQVSALLASPIVLLEIHRILAGLPPLQAGAAPHSIPGAAALAGLGAGLLHGIVTFAGGLFFLTIFAIVFLAFHAIQVLIALSPSALLDLGLRGFRFAVLITAAMAASVHPYVGAAFGLLILFAATLIAGWAFRLMVLGSIFARDLLFGSRTETGGASVASPQAFSGRGLAGAPVRSYGRFEADPQGRRRFVWRPWLLLPRRRIDLPAGDGRAIRRGWLSPSLFRIGAVREPTLARFPPRYRGREEALREALGADEVRDGRVVRGLRAAWRWLRATIRGEEAAEPGAAG